METHTIFMLIFNNEHFQPMEMACGGKITTRGSGGLVFWCWLAVVPLSGRKTTLTFQKYVEHWTELT